MNVLEPKGVCSDADSRSITGKSAGFSEREQVSRFARDWMLSATTAVRRQKSIARDSCTWNRRITGMLKS